MINFNGNIIQSNTPTLPITNRGFAYGDALFETIKYTGGKLLFWEDHYFRLMASMRILRMDIPMSFTMEFLEAEILKLITHKEQSEQALRVKLHVFREEGGLYTPTTNSVNYIVTTSITDAFFYELNESDYVVDLYKDHYVSPSLLSTLKSNNRLINIIGSVYAEENGLNNCLLVNTNKQVVEALNANLFLVKGNVIKTPPLADGALKGIIRKQVIDIIKLMPEYEIEESSVSPFELQKADELFLTNVITGIQPITQYRKKKFSVQVSKNILTKLNVKARLG